MTSRPCAARCGGWTREDPKTFRITDQYAIGDDIIVAPVVARGAVTTGRVPHEGLWVETIRIRRFSSATRP